MSRNEKIMSMFDAGQSYGEIASELGVSRSAVAGVVYRCRGARRVRWGCGVSKSPVIVSGVKYDCAREAGEALRVSPDTARYRAMSESFPDWRFA